MYLMQSVLPRMLPISCPFLRRWLDIAQRGSLSPGHPYRWSIGISVTTSSFLFVLCVSVSCRNGSWWMGRTWQKNNVWQQGNSNTFKQFRLDNGKFFSPSFFYFIEVVKKKTKHLGCSSRFVWGSAHYALRSSGRWMVLFCFYWTQWGLCSTVFSTVV